MDRRGIEGRGERANGARRGGGERRWVIRAVAGLGALALFVASASGQQWTITELQHLPGVPEAQDAAYAVNESGVAVGYCYGHWAVGWVDGLPYELGRSHPDAFDSPGRGINDSGVACGYYEAHDGLYHAFVSQDGVATDLACYSGLTETFAYGINNAGVVVGGATWGFTDAVCWQGDQVEPLYSDPNRAVDAWAYAISNTNPPQIVGYVAWWLPCELQVRNAVVFHGNNVVEYLLDPNLDSVAWAVSDNDHVAGQYGNVNGVRAALWRKVNGSWQMTDLGAGQASGVNRYGQVVGHCGTEAWAYVRDGCGWRALSDLLDPNSGWSLFWAWAVNDKGQIVGEGVHNGVGRAFLMTPAGCRGDMNCDGRVTFADIDLFVAALAGESAWGCRPCPWIHADINGDAAVNFADIDPFVALIGTTCP